MNPFANQNQKILSEQFTRIQELNTMSAKRRFYDRSYYHKNKAKYKQYYLENRERIKEYNRNYKTNGAKKVYSTKKNPKDKPPRDRSIKIQRGSFIVDLGFTQNRNSTSEPDTQSVPPQQSVPPLYPASVLVFFGLSSAGALKSEQKEQVQVQEQVQEEQV